MRRYPSGRIFPRAFRGVGIEFTWKQDTKWARLAVQNLILINLSDDQFSALFSFVFNVGRKNFKTAKILRLLNPGETNFAAGQFGRWTKARDRILQGLVAWRACEEMLFKSQLGLSSEFDEADASHWEQPLAPAP
ncbi:glycoside hydrolase family protein [Sinorhizobium meliloti]|nr:glycoside hydrolase family protein [Sinorhizobium meliloti]MDX0238249.1 glycoside hydrolase family protein [Sinorhizobium meliloti]